MQNNEVADVRSHSPATGRAEGRSANGFGKRIEKGQTVSSLINSVWRLCNILRGDGVGYREYIAELTYLLFLKLAEETGTEDALPPGCRWKDLVGYSGPDMLVFYREMLTHLGGHATDPVVRDIYAFPTTVFSHQENLRAVVKGLDAINWHSIDTDGMGDLYEGLLSRNSQDSRSGAGQYFTPRALVDSMVRVAKPAFGEIVQDPACGTGGFLIAANRHVMRKPNTKKTKRILYEGVEIEKGTFRIAQMNSFLHSLDATLILGDALTDDAATLQPADLILANPPFGNKSGGARALRQGLPQRGVNKQTAFLEHIRLSLKQGGRAAVVLPDNVLFESGAALAVRRRLMEDCDLHTVLRLPNGIFYSPGIHTNVLFFTRRSDDSRNSAQVGVYDLRTNMPRFSKTRILEDQHFAAFEEIYGHGPHPDRSQAAYPGDERWRVYDRAYIAESGWGLDLTWLLPESITDQEESGFEGARSAAVEHLQLAIAALGSLASDSGVEP